MSGGWLTSKELAVLAGVSDETVRRWRTKGGGPPWCKVGGSVRYRPHVVDEWMVEQERLRAMEHGMR